ncbi:MAG: hypothetical protein IJ916_13005 [Paludibacteraceae bacterium]|nr:hypothetical protein [Paludibacteraceae bacterium]
MSKFKSFPFKKEKPIFKELEKLADLSNFSDEERREYEDSLERHRINSLIFDACHDEGYEEGKIEGIRQGIRQEFLSIAKELKAKGFAVEVIMKSTHLSAVEIEKLSV